jgi:hypothetical protein
MAGCVHSIEHKYWLHQVNLGRTDLRAQYAGGRPPLDDLDAEILSFLRRYPFSSVRTIANSREIPASTIYSHLALNFLSWLGSSCCNQRVMAGVSRTLRPVTPGA